MSISPASPAVSSTVSTPPRSEVRRRRELPPPRRRLGVRRATALALLGLGLHAAPVWGLTQSNYVGILVGERPMGMGGAYTAVSDDPSGLFYNPAGIVYGHAPNLSASVNAFHRTTTRYARALGDTDWERDSQELLPNFFGTTQPLGPVTVGFSYAVPKAVREEQAQTFRGFNEDIESFSINVDNSDSVNEIGPSVAFELSPQLALGATLYYHQREGKTITTQITRLGGPVDPDNPDNDYELLNSYSTRTQSGVSWILGAIFSPSERIALGLSVRGTEIFSATNSFQAACHGSEAVEEGSYDGGLCSRGHLQVAERREDSVRDAYPIQARLGAAWFASQRLLIAGDLIHFTAVGGRNAVTNFALGTEYYLATDWAVRGGLYSDLANVSAVSYDGFDHRVDRYGGALSVTRFSRNSSVSVGINAAFGSGDAYIIDDPGAGAQEVSTTALTLFLATSYSY